MTLKGFGWFVVVILAGAGAAWYSAENELLGANPVWIESTAVYAQTRVVLARAGEAKDAQEGEGEKAPGAKTGAQAEPQTGTPPAEESKTEEKGCRLEPGPASPNKDARGPVGFEAFLKEFAREYEVQPGDSLSKIGGSFSVPFELVAKINGIEGSCITAGSVLKVVQGPFHALVLRKRMVLRLYCAGVWVKEYAVAVGKPGRETILGSFKVLTKMAEPPWTDPETRETIPFGTMKNPLGTRWIGFADGFGIHGTWEPESVGSAASRGCIRMRNEDVEDLFDFLIRKESKVDIVEDLEPEAKEEGEQKR